MRSIMRPVSAEDIPEVGSSSSSNFGSPGKGHADLQLTLFAIGKLPDEGRLPRSRLTQRISASAPLELVGEPHHRR